MCLEAVWTKCNCFNIFSFLEGSYSILKEAYHAHFQVDIYILGLYWDITAWFTVLKTPYLSYTGPLCSPSVQPLSVIGRCSSCLFKAPPPMSPLCSDWPALGSHPSETPWNEWTISLYTFSHSLTEMSTSQISVHVQDQIWERQTTQTLATKAM